MPENKGRFVTVCQQVLVLGAVAALAAPAVGVQSLNIVGPTPETAERPGASVPAVALVASEPVEPEVTEVPIKGVERAGLQALTRRPAAQRNAAADLAALSSPTEVGGFATVGVTWDAGQSVDEDEVSVSVRSLEGGEWSDWQTIEYHDDHGPDPDSAEARNARPGTDPIIVGDVDEVQVKIETADGKAPAGATLAVVDPRETPDPTRQAPAIDTAALTEEDDLTLSSATTGTTDTGTTADPATELEVPEDGSEPDGVLTGEVGITPKPQIFSRAQWGADESMRDRSSLSYYEVHAGFVHHTVNANDYTRAQVPALLRGIYAYHTRSKGWSDIGYNFVVDRFGRIWEGRYGGVDRPVVGAHTLGYNEYSFAMSALGNFDTAKPSSAMLDAYGRLFAWKLSLHGVSASSAKQWVGKQYFPAINGHRDAGSTACPGRYLYAQLGQIRSLAVQYQAPFTARTRSANLAGSPWPDLVVRDEATRRVSMVRTGGQTNFQRGRRAASGWKGMDLIAASRDLTGDGIPDVVGRNASTKVTSLYPGTAQATLGAPVLRTTRFANVDQLVGAMDMTGDGNADLVARVAGTSNLWVYPGNGKGGFTRRRLLSRDWGGYGLTAAVGDFDGDGRNDLVGRKRGRLWLVPGGTRPRLGAPVRLPGSWGNFSLISGAGDVTNDGNPDLVVKVNKSRNVFVHEGDGAGGLRERLGPFRNLGRLNYIAAAGQLAGEAGADLIGRNARGALVVFPNNGAKNIEAVTDTGLRLRAANLILNVGDWNGDGFGDIMTRTPLGRMDLRLGNGSGGWAPPVVAARGWRKVGLLAAVGDITGDGHPDLMGQPAGMAMRIYPGDGAGGFLPSFVAHSAIKSDRHTGLGLWDADGSPDSLLRRGDGALLLYRGNGPGGLLNPTTVGKGTNGYDWLQSVGDATGDSRPDVIARERATGKLWLLPGTRKGFGVRRLIGVGFGAYDLSS
ncbi:MAG TPA: FG-GAP-like repeat-containing protein [Nocardioidaceae bacterium]|nr:FG-GAP-like repeat-containing protein [Nocardioidaceae bacterium]